MDCDSPQYVLPLDPKDPRVGFEACGLCLSCCRIKEVADRARRLFWLKRKRGSYV